MDQDNTQSTDMPAEGAAPMPATEAEPKTEEAGASMDSKPEESEAASA